MPQKTVHLFFFDLDLSNNQIMLSIKVLKSKLFPMQNHTTQRSKENITEFLIT